MRRSLLICALAAFAWWGSPAGEPTAAAQAPTGDVTVRSRVERAPDGSLRRGRVDVPSWVVLAGGGALALAAAAVLAVRIGRGRK